MDGEDDYDNYFDDDWTWNSDRKPGLGGISFCLCSKGMCSLQYYFPLLKNASRFWMSQI